MKSHAANHANGAGTVTTASCVQRRRGACNRRPDRSRNTVTAENRPHPPAADDADLSRRDTSVKKNAAVTKKLRAITEETRAQLLADIGRLNMARVGPGRRARSAAAARRADADPPPSPPVLPAPMLSLPVPPKPFTGAPQSPSPVPPKPLRRWPH
jgi:hypothetical protein